MVVSHTEVELWAVGRRLYNRLRVRLQPAVRGIGHAVDGEYPACIPMRLIMHKV